MRYFVGLSAALLMAAFPAARAQTYPLKPVRVIVPLPPSGPLERMARGLAESLGRGLGQPFVIYEAIGVQANDYRKASPVELAAFQIGSRAMTVTVLGAMGLTEK